MLLSIIVPVYNVEKYLNRCVDSLLDQGDFSDYEVILVDDGSTDSSGKICDDYAERFEVVRTIHKENGGASSSRNLGIINAKGKFIMFVDSDDYVKSDCLSFLINKLLENNLDILSYNFIYSYGLYNISENSELTDFFGKIVTGEEFLIKCLKNQSMLMTVWKYIYKKDIIIDNCLFFREGVIYEDEEWVPRTFFKANRVMQIDDIVYCYCIRHESVSNNKSKVKSGSLDLLSNCKSLKRFSQSIGNTELKDLIENNIVTLALSAYFRGQLTESIDEIKDLLSGLHVENTNVKKVSLFLHNPIIYLKVNYILKRLKKFKNKGHMIFSYLKKCMDYTIQKIHIYTRKFFVCRKQRKKLKNHTFSIISSTCNGGVITSELGEQFRTPTVNLWIKADDFVKMTNNLKYYMSIDVLEVKNNFYPYPVGKIDDITIYFMHYKSFDEARKKWNTRKQRINYDNIYLLMAERDGCNFELIQRFDNLTYPQKVIFTAKEYPGIKSSIFVEKYKCNNEVDILTDYVGLTGRKYDEYFDYVDWLNKGEYKHLL